MLISCRDSIAQLPLPASSDRMALTATGSSQLHGAWWDAFNLCMLMKEDPGRRTATIYPQQSRAPFRRFLVFCVLIGKH